MNIALELEKINFRVPLSPNLLLNKGRVISLMDVMKFCVVFPCKSFYCGCIL